MQVLKFVIVIVTIAAAVGVTVFCLGQMFALAQAGKTAEVLIPFSGLLIGGGGLYWLFSVIIRELPKL